MIYTVTINPAIDYLLYMKKITHGTVNRADREIVHVGGKGINVSIVLRELGVASVAMGFVAGFTGQAIEQALKEKGITTDFVRLPEGNSRINVKLHSAEETELNGRGPDIAGGQLEQLFEKFKSLTSNDLLVLAGSIPDSLPRALYAQIMAQLAPKKMRIVVDATKELLFPALPYHPFLIKPNKQELEEMFGVTVTTGERVEKYARKLQKMGALNVLVSMGAEGALLVDAKGKLYEQKACTGILKNSVGAGDSMVAGFLAGSLKGDMSCALKLGTAAGGATAFSEGMADGGHIEKMFQTL